MKKIVINLMIIILTFSIICIIPNQSLADKTNTEKDGESRTTSTNKSGGGGTSGSTFITSVPNADGFNPEKISKTEDEKGDDAALLGKANKIIGWVEIIGVIVSVLVLSVLGIKYMVGSVEEKAQYKKSMQPYVIGCVLTFGIMTILKIISSIAGLIK